jgi:hypothetical protein
MPYHLDRDEDEGSGSGSGSAEAQHDDEDSRSCSLATLVAGFAALAPPPQSGERSRDLPDFSTAAADAGMIRPSGRIRSALASISATSASSAASVDALQINETYDGLRVLWDVTFAGGSGTVIIITPPRKRDPDGDAVPLAAHVSWRGADAIPACDVQAFASVLMQAAQKADSLPVAFLPEH